jgi:hypothetical protein
MPKGPKVSITHKGIKYQFSVEQYELLAKGTVKADRPLEWETEVRVRGLTKRGLFVKRKGSFVRTILGSAVVQEYNNRTKSKEAAKAAAKE